MLILYTVYKLKSKLWQVTHPTSYPRAHMQIAFNKKILLNVVVITRRFCQIVVGPNRAGMKLITLRLQNFTNENKI